MDKRYRLFLCIFLEWGSAQCQCLQAALAVGRAGVRGQLQRRQTQAIVDAQAKWQEYKSKQCEAVYLRWQQGTIRGPKAVRCDLDLTRQRTHRIWSDFLTYPDSTPPILPEPKA